MAERGEVITAQREAVETVGDAEGRRARLLHKVAVTVPLALLLVYLLGWAGAVQEYKGLEGVVRWTDFKSTLTGALVIRDGHGSLLYDLDTQLDAQNRVLAPYVPPIGRESILPYNHLPFEALLVAPLMGLPYSAIFLLWTLLMALALGLSLWIMQRVLPMPRAALLVAVLAAVTYQPLFRSFVLGQNSPLVLLGLCGTYAALKRERAEWAGASMLLVALKPQILPVVGLMLLLERRWRALSVFVGLLAALCLAAMLVLGPGWPLQYAQLLLGVANWGNTGAIDPAIMHNWRGFATNLFAAWAPGLVTPIFALLALSSVALLVWAWLRSGPEPRSIAVDPAPAAQMTQQDLLWALAGVVAVLTSLHLNPHDLTLLIFPAWIAAAHALSTAPQSPQSRRWLYIIWVAYAWIPLTFYLTSADAPALAVVPNVLLMAATAIILARRVTAGVETLER
jgi:hypothetical protein